MWQHCLAVAPAPVSNRKNVSGSLWVLLLLLAFHGGVHGLAKPADEVSGGHRDKASRQAFFRCRGTKPGWCGPFYHQASIPAVDPRAFDKSCEGNCNGVGVCNAQLGVCDCPAGWAGHDCKRVQKRPCAHSQGQYTGPGSEPANHVGADGRDKDWLEPGWTASRCPGVCDDDIAACYCEGEKFGRIPAPPGSPPGTPPIRVGRPMSDICKSTTDKQGRPTDWGLTTYDNLYGPEGWCNSSQPAFSCECAMEGLAGPLCDQPVEMTCLNQCSGMGECQLGFCKCKPGRWGADCAQRTKGEPPLPEQSPALAAKPWLMDHLTRVPAAEAPAPGATRRRPLIYVYDMPAEFVTRMLQYRHKPQSCTWRFFSEGNASQLNDAFLYALEMALHEMLLVSPHRTMDPEEADFFYVPTYTSCFMWPVSGWADYPWYYTMGGPRTKHTCILTLLAKRWVQEHHPYWNRTNGADHIFLYSHDEGACWAPREVFNNAIVFSHWGRVDENPERSFTSYGWDNYNWDFADPALTTWHHPSFANKSESWTALIKPYGCYLPDKHLLIPSLKRPAQYRWSPLFGPHRKKRKTLLFFRGDVGKERIQEPPAEDPRHPIYSRRIRQRLFKLATEQDWRSKYNILIGDPNDVPGDYSEGLASSKFCAVLPGDGWSARAEDAILHGCVPVVIMDNIHTVFQSVIEWDLFSIRIKEDSLASVPDILLSIPAERYARMQMQVFRVMRRFAYFSHPLLRANAEAIMERYRATGAGDSGEAQTEWDRQLDQEDDLIWEETHHMHEDMMAMPGQRDVAAEVATTGVVKDAHNARRKLARWLRQLGVTFGAAWGVPGDLTHSGTGSSGAQRHIAAEHSSRPSHSRRRRSYVLHGHAWEDDALGTIMQWLYSRLPPERMERQA